MTPRQKYEYENRERINARKRAWRVANLEKARASSRAHARRWRSENKEAWRAISKRHWLNQKYGITVEQYETMLTAQGGVCAICKRPEKYLRKDGTPKDLSVDHNHATGEVRGLLCMSCNTALGKMDDGRLFVAAATYIAKGGHHE